MRISTFFIILFFFAFSIQAQQKNLDYYLNEAKNNSPVLFKNKNDVVVLNLNLDQVKRVLSKPEINVEAAVLFAPIISHDTNSSKFELTSAGATNYNGYDLAISNGGQYTSMISLKQPLFTGNSFKQYQKKSDILLEQKRNNSNLTEHQLEQLVKNQYILCLKSKKESEISLDQLTELKSQLAIMKKLVESAIYKQTDLLLLQIEYQNYNLAYQTNLTAYKSSMYDLNLLCGIKDSVIPDISDVNFELEPSKNSQSKFMISYQLDSLALIANQHLNELKYKPQVNLFANAGLNAVYQPTINRVGFSTGVSFTWNIFDGNQRTIQRKIVNLNLESLNFEKNNFKTQNNIYKIKILNQIKALSEKTNLLNKQIADYKKLVDIYYQEFSQTIISIMDYKNLLKDVTAKKQELVQLEMEKELLINSYNYWNY